MYAVAARLDPDSYLALARATFAEMRARRRHRRRRVPLPAPRPRRPPLRRPERDGPRPGAGGRRRRDPADPARHLLPRRGRRSAAARSRASSGGSPTAPSDAWAERVAALRDGPGLRIGVAVHSVRAVPRDGAGRPSPRRRGGRPLHVHLSEQPAENAACLAAHGLTPTGLLADEGLLGPATTAVHATHLTADDIALLGGSGTTACLCPTTERDLADGLGPGPGTARRRLPARARRRPARRHRPVRGGARAGDARAAGVRGARPLHPRGPARRPDRARRPRLARRRAAGGRGARRPRRRPARHARGRRERTRRRWCSPRAPPTSTPWWSTATSSSRRPARARRRRRAAAGRHRAAVGGRMSDAASCVDRRSASSVHQRTRRSAPDLLGIGLAADAARRRRGRHDRLGRPGRARPRGRPADRRRRPGRRPRVRRLPLAPRLRRRPGGRVRRPDARASATTAGGSPRPSPPPAPPTTPHCARCWPAGSPRCAPRAPRPSRSRAATASPSPTRSARCAWPPR